MEGGVEIPLSLLVYIKDVRDGENNSLFGNFNIIIQSNIL